MEKGTKMGSLTVLLGPPGVMFVGAILGGIGAVWAAQQQATFERDLRKKSDEIASLNTDIAKLITGGDSYCHLDFSLDEGQDAGLIVAIHHGQHPIYEGNVRLVDIDQAPPRTYQEVVEQSLIFGIGNLPASGSIFLGPIDLRGKNQWRYNIFFSARNGWHTQKLRLKKVEGVWRSATCVFRSDAPEDVLYEKIDEEFPRSDTGGVVWD